MKIIIGILCAILAVLTFDLVRMHSKLKNVEVDLKEEYLNANKDLTSEIEKNKDVISELDDRFRQFAINSIFESRISNLQHDLSEVGVNVARVLMLALGDEDIVALTLSESLLNRTDQILKSLEEVMEEIKNLEDKPLKFDDFINPQVDDLNHRISYRKVQLNNLRDEIEKKMAGRNYDLSAEKINPKTIEELQGDKESTNDRSSSSSVHKSHTIKIKDQVIELSSETWKPMKNEYEWAENFESDIIVEDSVFGTVLTIFKLPMPQSEKFGKKLSENEYLEMFSIKPDLDKLPPPPKSYLEKYPIKNQVICKLKVNKGNYWLMTRDTFEVKSADAAKIKSDETAYSLIYFEIEDKINSLRYFLSQK